MEIVVEQVRRPTGEVRALIGELDAALGAMYAPHQRHGLRLEHLFQPHLRFFLARLDGAAAGCGGVALFDDYAEVKRMYTRPAARGHGVAKALLHRIETEARASGKPLLRLETGDRLAAAIGLYERTGFRRRGPFGPYSMMPAANIETSLFFEKSLSPAASPGG